MAKIIDLKKEKKQWKRCVDNKMKCYGETDFDKKKIRVNKKKSKTNPFRKRPVNKGAHKYPDILDTIVHEELHRKNPKMKEKDVRKMALALVKKMPPSQKKKYYAKYK